MRTALWFGEYGRLEFKEPLFSRRVFGDICCFGSIFELLTVDCVNHFRLRTSLYESLKFKLNHVPVFAFKALEVSTVCADDLNQSFLIIGQIWWGAMEEVIGFSALRSEIAVHGDS